MKTTDQIIDEIILKSPHGGKLWKQRLKKKYAAQNDTFQNEDLQGEDSSIKDEPMQDHPKQTYIKF